MSNILNNKCAIYLRFSSNNQHETSIEMQRKAVSEYAQRNNYKIVAEYADRALTATTAETSELSTMYLTRKQWTRTTLTT